MNAKFNVRTLDTDTRNEYEVSEDFVEVSDAFAKRLIAHPQYGTSFEVEGYEAPKAKVEDEEKLALRGEYEILFKAKAGNKSVETMKSEIEAEKLRLAALEGPTGNTGGPGDVGEQGDK